MTRYIKSMLMLIAGLCWFIAALGFAVLLFQYLVQGAGLQIFGFFLGSTTVLIGLVHVVGFATAAFLCFAIGVGFCVHVLVPPANPGTGSGGAQRSFDCTRSITLALQNTHAAAG